MCFDSQTFKIATGLLFLVKDTAVEISISCCVCQGPGTLVAMETNIQPLVVLSFRAAFEHISQFDTMLLLLPLK